MAKAVFWKSDWMVGAVVTLLMLLAGVSSFMQSLEYKAYDLGMQAASRTPSDRVAVIAIDEQSIANLGPWPWSRALHARLTDRLAAAPAKVIGTTVVFAEPYLDPGYGYINQLIDIVNQSALEAALPNPAMDKISALLIEAEVALNTDRKLADSYAKAGSVVLPMLFEAGEKPRRPEQSLPDFVTKNRLVNVVEAGGSALPVMQVQVPPEVLGGKAVALGHLGSSPDSDGIVRREALVVQYADQYYPSLSLTLAARSLDLGPGDLRVRLGETVRLGKLRIPTDSGTRMNTFFYKGSAEHPAFPVDSFADVLSGKIPASKYAGKIVLIGSTAAAIGPSQVTPVSPSMAPVLSLAHAVSSILQQHFFVTPAWGAWAGRGVVLIIGLYLMLALPKLRAGLGAMTTLGLLLALIGGHFGLMLGAGMWIPLAGAASLLLIGHLLLTAKRFLRSRPDDEKPDSASAESNRMLGLAFQGQGQLDMAFDKFRKCPLNDGLMENIYNLALDYERQRQFTKAEAVFRYLFDHNPKFRDLQARLNRPRPVPETAVPAGVQGQAATDTNIQLEKPMLGRYQLEKELGKGAMGVVYLGRDLKINRVVALKTMALAQEFGQDELVDVRQRFFREAETAGRLNHPNIVTIYDAGEAQDLAYIAMEFLPGRDLVPQSKPGGLLPLRQVLSILARVADALDYAHRQNIVHRDIKPANIMYEAASDQVKVTDFGIARITDSSRTKTGMILGTPSYMSPEQLAGKPIDGRSDLFSLGVMLYQMSCGQLPFTGDSLVRLMFNITNTAPVDILSINPALPPALVAVVNKALSKNVEARYQRGAEVAADLRACLEKLPVGVS